MSRWPTAPISAVCSVNPRREVLPSPDALVGFVPMAAVDEGDGSIAVIEQRPYAAVAKGFTAFRPRDVIFAKITPCMENGKAALVGEMPNGMGFGSTEFHVLRAGARILPEVVHAWVRRAEFRAEAKANFKGTAGQQRVPSDFFDRAFIPVPPLAEQRRIVDLLNRAAGIRRLHEAALAKARETIPALFLSMFGNPATNSMGWPSTRLGDLLPTIDSGWSPRCDEGAPSPDNWGVLKLGAVTWGEYQDAEAKRLPEQLDPRPAIEVHTDDILMVRKNTYDLVGAVAYVWETRPKLMFSDLIFRFHPTADAPIRGHYLWGCLASGPMRERTRRLASGAAASMPNISKGRLAELIVPLPPLALQGEYASRLTDLRSIVSQQERALAIAHDTERALMARLLG